MTFQKSLNDFINSVACEFGSWEAIVEIAITPEVFMVVMDELIKYTVYNGMNFIDGSTMLMGVNIVPKARDDMNLESKIWLYRKFIEMNGLEEQYKAFLRNIVAEKETKNDL